MNDYLTDLETSKKLKEAGVDAPSKFIRYITVYGDSLLFETAKIADYTSEHKDRIRDLEQYPAYLLQELLEIAKEGLNSKFDGKLLAVLLSAALGRYLTGDENLLKAVAEAILD